MFVLRPAITADEGPLARMIRARSAWMRERGVSGWDSWAASAPQLAAQAADPVFPVWVLTAGEDGEVAGCTSLYPQSPPRFWTEAEQAEPALFMATTVTSPAFAGQRLGALIAWAALDLAARAGRTRVRRSTTEAGLVRYYRDVQGWQVVRQLERQGFLVTAMEREAGPQPGLPVCIADADVPVELS